MQTQNEDGSWTLENIQRNRLWAVHDALLALNTFAEKIITNQTANRLYLLEHTLLVSSKTHKNTLPRQVFVSAFSLFTIGIAVGLILSAFLGFNNPVKFWIEKYWAWLILGLYIISAVPLVRLRVIIGRMLSSASLCLCCWLSFRFFGALKCSCPTISTFLHPFQNSHVR